MQGAMDRKALESGGLNLIAIFDVKDLPTALTEALLAAVQGHHACRQVILVGHGGRDLWTSLDPEQRQADDPIDTHTRQLVSSLLNASPQCRSFEFVYPPSDKPVPLIGLGALAGWHRASKFRVGINQLYGTWYAYRALVVADSDFEVTRPMSGASPCDGCAAKPCMAACPVSAVGEARFDFEACYRYRLTDGSACSHTCLARVACPVGADHRYAPDQIEYHYGLSLKSLKAYAAAK